MPGASDAKRIINEGAAARVERYGDDGKEFAARSRTMNECVKSGMNLDYARRFAEIELDLMRKLRDSHLTLDSRPSIREALEAQDVILREMLDDGD